MVINQTELISILEASYETDVQASNSKKEIRENLKAYAENNEISTKAINAAYTLYKNYKSGKLSSDISDDYFSLTSVVDDYFTNGNNSSSIVSV